MLANIDLETGGTFDGEHINLEMKGQVNWIISK